MQHSRLAVCVSRLYWRGWVNFLIIHYFTQHPQMRANELSNIALQTALLIAELSEDWLSIRLNMPNQCAKSTANCIHLPLVKWQIWAGLKCSSLNSDFHPPSTYHLPIHASFVSRDAFILSHFPDISLWCAKPHFKICKHNYNYFCIYATVYQILNK